LADHGAAAKCTVVQVAETAELGALDPEAVVTPRDLREAHRARRRTGEKAPDEESSIASRWRALARTSRKGRYVNLGIGLPTLVADYLPKGREIILHSENGISAWRPKPRAGRGG